MSEKLKKLYKNMTPRERMLFYGAVASAIFVLTDLVILNPVLSHIKVLEAEIEAKSQGIQRDLRILSFKKGILKEYRRYEQYLDTGEKSQDEIIGGLLKRLEGLAAASGVTITNVMPGEIEDKPIYKVYKTTLEFEGPLQNTLAFMSNLEESDNLFQIKRYLLAPKSKTGQVMKCSLDVERILITSEDVSALASDEEPVQKAPADSAEVGSEPAPLPSEIQNPVGSTMETAVPEPI